MLPPTFRSPHLPNRKEVQRAAEQRRGSARKRGYSAKWDRVSESFRRNNPLCLGCEAVGDDGVTEVTDHIIPHRGDMGLFWDPSNRQPCCAWHHDKVKQILEQRYARGEISADALKLDSPEAVALTNSLLGKG